MKLTNALLALTFVLASNVVAKPCGCDDSGDNNDVGYDSSSSMDDTLGASNPASNSAGCDGGDYQCSPEGNVMQCDQGHYVTWKCGKGTKCMDIDFECVPLERWDEVWSIVHATTSTTTSSTLLAAPSPKPAPQPPSGSCNNGEFQCYNNNVIQCNLGKWVLWECQNGTQCVPNDYECVGPL